MYIVLCLSYCCDAKYCMLAMKSMVSLELKGLLEPFAKRNKG